MRTSRQAVSTGLEQMTLEGTYSSVHGVGARISLTIGLAAALIDVLIGVIWGAISGIRGGRTDEIMMRIADILWAIPSLLMTILLLVVMGKGLITMIVAMVITGWINMARIVRG